MDFLKRTFTPAKSKKGVILPQLHDIDDEIPKKKKNKKGDFTVNNLNVKDFTDKEIQQWYP